MVQARFDSQSSSGGFSLTEVVIAMALLTTVSLGVAQLFAISTHANLTAKSVTSTTAIAEQKLEQLRALTWGFDLAGNGLPVSDTSTNLAVWPPQPNGPGLNPSPSDTLVINTPGYVDYLDAGGNWLGTGIAPPEGTVFIRRWSVLPLPTNPNNTLILQVLVTPVGNDTARQQDPTRRSRLPGDSLLVSVKTRKSI